MFVVWNPKGKVPVSVVKPVHTPPKLPLIPKGYADSEGEEIAEMDNRRDRNQDKRKKCAEKVRGALYLGISSVHYHPKKGNERVGQLLVITQLPAYPASSFYHAIG